MFASLKGMIFEEDPQAAKPAVKPATLSGGAATSSFTTSAPTVNPEFVAAIKKSVFSKQTALTTLVDAAEKLVTIIPDMHTRYKAAYATASGGRTVKQVADAAEIHLADIEGEVMRFKAAAGAKLGTEAKGLEQEAKNIENSIAMDTNEISHMQTKIAQMQARISENSGHLAVASQKAAEKRAELENANAQFELAAQLVREELTTLRQTVLTSLN